MNTRISTTTRLAAAAVVAAGLSAGAVLATAGNASADGFANGPWCNGPAKVLAESQWSQVAICPVQGPTGWAYKGNAKATGGSIALWGAEQNYLGFHAFNNGYTYHVHRDRLLITAPNGTTVANEPWISYIQR